MNNQNHSHDHEIPNAANNDVGFLKKKILEKLEEVGLENGFTIGSVTELSEKQFEKEFKKTRVVLEGAKKKGKSFGWMESIYIAVLVVLLGDYGFGAWYYFQGGNSAAGFASIGAAMWLFFYGLNWVLDNRNRKYMNLKVLEARKGWGESIEVLVKQKHSLFKGLGLIKELKASLEKVEELTKALEAKVVEKDAQIAELNKKLAIYQISEELINRSGKKPARKTKKANPKK